MAVIKIATNDGVKEIEPMSTVALDDLITEIVEADDHEEESTDLIEL